MMKAPPTTRCLEFHASSRTQAHDFTIMLEVDELRSSAILKVNNRVYEIEQLRRAKGLDACGNEIEEVRLLHGTRNSNGISGIIIVVVNCGVTPPEFRIDVDLHGHTKNRSSFAISHETQDEINLFIDSLHVESSHTIPSIEYVAKDSTVRLKAEQNLASTGTLLA